MIKNSYLIVVYNYYGYLSYLSAAVIWSLNMFHQTSIHLIYNPYYVQYTVYRADSLGSVAATSCYYLSALRPAGSRTAGSWPAAGWPQAGGWPAGEQQAGRRAAAGRP